MEEPTAKYPRGKHPNSQANLKSFKPGQSGNPGGCPKGIHYVSEALRRLLTDKAMVDQIAKELMKRAKKSDNSLNILLDRTEGKVTQPIGIEGDTKITFTIGKGYDEGSRSEVSTDQ